MNAATRAAAARDGSARSAGGGAAGRILRILALGLAGGAAVIAGYWLVVVRPRLQAIEGVPPKPSRTKNLDLSEGAFAEASASLELGLEPMGLAWDGRSFVLSARGAPGGLVRLTRTAEGFGMQRIPVIEPAYSQEISLWSIAWNGREHVGLADGAWFQAQGPVFTIHDPATLQVVSTTSAPAGVGAVTWDGHRYWAATRKNTPDEAVSPRLFELDASLAVTRTMDAPAGGCQGLAWDGSHLWWADVFGDELLKLDVSGAEPVVVERRGISASHLSGIAWDGTNLWVVEYGDGALHRLRGGASSETSSVVATAYEAVPSRPAEAGSDDVEALLAQVREGSFQTVEAARRLQEIGEGARTQELLREMLFSEDTFERLNAENALKTMGLPVDRARELESSPDTGPEDTDLLDLRCWMEGSDLHASWQVHVGEALVAGIGGEAGNDVLSMPTFARYEVSIEGGSLPAEIERTYEAGAGLNEKSDEILATGLGPGTYDVSVFIHVQTRGADGGLRVLNDSAGGVSLSP